MAKPSRENVQSGLNGWEGSINNNFVKLFDRPVPVFLHTGDETDLETGFPAAGYEEALCVVNHTTLGLTLYLVDKNHPSGSAKWIPLGAYLSNPPVVANTSQTLDWDARQVISNPGGPITLTLRPAGQVPGKVINVKNVSTNTVTLSAASNIDGAVSYPISVQYQSVTLYSDGSTYHII